MASSQASMVASRMVRFSNSSLQNLIRRHLFPPATTSAAATATVGVINNFPESLFRPPFFIETPNPNQQVFPIRMDEAILYGNRIGLAAFPGVEQARLFARGDPVKIDDEFNDEDADDDEDDEDADDFEDEGDFDDDFDEDNAADDDADPRYKKRK